MSKIEHKKAILNHQALNGALVLSGAALISKILSAVYRVPFQNLVGNVGFYIYQQVYPIYGILMTLALTGLPVFISKIMAEQPNQISRKRLYWQLLILLSLISGIALIVVQLLAPWLSFKMGDPNLSKMIRAVSLLLILMPFLSTSRGFFQGSLKMHPTAISQVLEQIFRVIMIILVAMAAHFHHWNLYRMGKDTMLAAFFAGILASIVLLYYFKSESFSFEYYPEISYPTLFKRLLNEGGILCVLASLVVLMQLVDSFTIKKNLLIYGMTNFDAQNAKGIYDRAQPLVQLGLVIGTGFATGFIPSLVKNYRKKFFDTFKNNARMMVQVSMTLTFAIAMGIISLIHPINILLFKNAADDDSIGVYCLSIVFATMIVIHNSVLQSLNRSANTWISITIGMIVKIILVSWFVRRVGIMGGSLSTVIALFTIWVINYLCASDFIKQSLYPKLFFLKIILISIGEGIGLFLLQREISKLFLMPSRFGSLILMLMMVPIGIIIFIGLCFIFKIFKAQDQLKQMLKMFRSKITK
ncbi:sugar transporter [Philodulcilactobacillus myokoensis]|uniref:Sugar transporter n=1 Tax=Philodulcilactobacillus myokoensis TaxID=2929573 RepID=A0A9W6B2G6_9LACO|nr:polysaccharide biosynthesis protein [Philodulcilactobacillus myokoensis]GLB47205.1 sugar transporter [Philodulcilactobacillus myokoensis]